ncbi:MAG: cytochrome c biogenesis protein CcsA [Alphaproteobacteria bacterium]|nr:cytochrome c biogenesis protein CcsA [Alphaproteobacteria bacterium]
MLGGLREMLGNDRIRAPLFWAVLAALTAAAVGLGPVIERSCLAAGLLSAVAASVAAPSRRGLLGATALVFLTAAGLSLSFRLLGDDFSYSYVWLLSAPELAWYLKLSNLWAGEAGTLLCLALVGLVMARRLSRYDGWAGPGAFVVAAFFIAGTLIWDPFAQTGAAQLASAVSLGMNAHLTRIWMAVHPPLVFVATMLLLAPVGSALQAMATGTGAWRPISDRYSRGAWLILSAGIAFGMWWAYEDFAYGTVWHWDPVQTASFVVWCLLTAQLHAQKRYRTDGAFGLIQPLMALLAAAAIVVSMIVTRSPVLASSHRYVGDTSLPLLGVLLGALTLAVVAALIYRWRRGFKWRPPAGEKEILIWLAMVLFAGAGAIGLGQIAFAYGSAYLDLPRPSNLKPFFETLTRFAHGGEIESLRRAFAQWDIDNFSTNAWLAPLGAVVGFVGGHYFLPLAGRWRWTCSVGAVALAIALAWFLEPFGGFYKGTGLTSSNTVAIFPWLDVMIVAAFYLAAAVVAWSIAAAVRNGSRRAYAYYGPVALIHAGAMIVVGAGLAATVLDSYTQTMVQLPRDFGKQLRFPGGYSLRVGLTESDWKTDGARANGGDAAFHAIARVEWALTRDGQVVEAETGHTVYRDQRPPYSDEIGPVRMMCEIVDYRYARYASDDRQMIHPFISRGLWRDVQVWFPAVSYPSRLDATEGSLGEGSGTAPMVLKVIPAMSWIWIGLCMVIGGFALLYLFEWRRPTDREAAENSL